jgi:hypothetical protein
MVVSCGDADPEPYKVWARTQDPVILSLNIRPQNVVNSVVSLFHNRGCTDSNPRMGGGEGRATAQIVGNAKSPSFSAFN